MLKGSKTPKIVLAGSTGYLGRYIAKAMANNGYSARLLARDPQKLSQFESGKIELVKAEVTDAKSLHQLCNGIDTVISTVGITRQKDGLTYMDVDFQANMNLLNEAKRAGVRKFIYISAINGDKHRNLKILEAKEAFVDELKASGLEYSIVRPNGFFSDMKEFLVTAKKGKVFLFGNGEQLLNPIHGEDLAQMCLELINEPIQEKSLGGPDILTQTEIAELAFDAVGKVPNIVYLPDWLRRLTIWTMRTFTPVSTYGPIEFFLTLMADDSVATRFGNRHLKDFYFKSAKTL